MCDSKNDCTDGSDEKYCFKNPNPGNTDDQNSDSTTKKPDFSTTETPIIIGNKTGKCSGRNLYSNIVSFFWKRVVNIAKSCDFTFYVFTIGKIYRPIFSFFKKKLSQMKDLVILNFRRLDVVFISWKNLYKTVKSLNLNFS